MVAEVSLYLFFSVSYLGSQFKVCVFPFSNPLRMSISMSMLSREGYVYV